MDGGAEHHLVAGKALGIDHHRPAEAVLDLGDLRLDLALALLGGMIFGILGKVAVRARFFDRVDDRRPLDGLEVPNVAVQLLIAFGQHRHLVHGRHPIQPFVKNSAWPSFFRRPPQWLNCVRDLCSGNGIIVLE